MQPAFTKRDWAYAGISHPAGVVLARPPKQPNLKPGNKVILVGDELAACVGPFLGKLAIESNVNFRFEWERGMLLERWASPERMERIVARCPSVLVFALSTALKETPAIETKLQIVRAHAKGVPLRWVMPLVDTDTTRALACALAGASIPAFESNKVDIHRSQTGAPSARGCAGLAGAIWGAIR